VKRKLKGEILQSATERAEYCGGYFKGQHIYGILNNVWRIAFKRGKAAGRAEVENEINKENEEIRVEQEHVYENGISKGVMGR